jgi:dihydrofolate synthase/folylpolyglutamate synthase
MNYAQCLDYLEKIQTLGIKFGLDNVRTVLKALGNPHEKFPSVIVAGSNGKGSVCAMLSRILDVHGFKAGLFTSPHLERPEERLRINNHPVNEADFCLFLTELREKIKALVLDKKLASHPTYFETMCCLAFLYFAAREVDIAVMEVGMGGRFDATNIAKPLVSVITTISFEHEKWLGDTLAKIAFEKAGIIKPGVPVVCGAEAEEAYQTINSRAEEESAPFIPAFSGERKLTARREGTGCSFEYKTPETSYAFFPSLPGCHQGKNAAVAITAAEVLARVWKKLEQKKIVHALESTDWEGRLEILTRNPLVILDGAHNEEGTLALRKYADEFIPRPMVLVYAAMSDKNIERMAEILFPAAEEILLTRFPFRKAASPSELRAKIPAPFHDRLILEPEPFAALSLAMSRLDSPSPFKSLLVAGSLFLIGEAKKFFRKNLENSFA